MSEVRQDPVTGVSVVLEPRRAGRPRGHGRTPDEATDIAECPFCPGHEDMTPPTRLELGASECGTWAVRVFENRYPALSAGPDEDWARELDAPWPYRGTTGFGVHEVIVESAGHHDTLADYGEGHATLLVEAWAERIGVWRADARFAAAVLFRNFGRAAGASQSHPHTQLIAMPRVPESLVRELGQFAQEATEGGRCVLCAAMDADDAGGRTIFDDGITVAHSPWAAPSPYFVRIAPRRCSATLADATSEERASFGRALVAVARALRGALGDVAHNIVLHDAPYSAQRAGLPFHWHAEVLPRVGGQAGLEWGSGVYLNVIDPDEAAATLRGGLVLV